MTASDNIRLYPWYIACCGLLPWLPTFSFCKQLVLRSLWLHSFFLLFFFALKSGYDTSFLYDSLQQLDRTEEYSEREAHAEKVVLSMLLGSFAVAIGSVRLDSWR